MDTDGHGYQGLAEQASFTQRVNEKSGLKSVFIRVHPWFLNSLSHCNCGI